MEFELQYNSVVLNNKNFFYFSNYCNDYQEFTKWLEYNHNNVTIEEFEKLDKEKQSIYLDIKKSIIIDKFRGYQKGLKEITKQYLNDYNTDMKMRKYLIIEMYDFYLQNKYYVEIIKDHNNPVKEIYNFIKNYKHKIEKFYTRN